MPKNIYVCSPGKDYLVLLGPNRPLSNQPTYQKVYNINCLMTQHHWQCYLYNKLNLKYFHPNRQIHNQNFQTKSPYMRFYYPAFSILSTSCYKLHPTPTPPSTPFIQHHPLVPGIRRHLQPQLIQHLLQDRITPLVDQQICLNIHRRLLQVNQRHLPILALLLAHERQVAGRSDLQTGAEDEDHVSVLAARDGVAVVGFG